VAAVTALWLQAGCRSRATAPASAEQFIQVAQQAAVAARAFLQWMENATERLAPERSVALATEARDAHAEPLRAARAALDAVRAPPELTSFAQRFADGFGHVEQALDDFTSSPDAPMNRRIGAILSALHHAARAQETFYSVRRSLPAFADFWQLPGTEVAEPAADAQRPDTGVIHHPPEGHHGGFSLYVPENYTTERPWPLIVALHGAAGNGRDFLWVWVREAKSLGYLVVAPTALTETWSSSEDVGLLEIISWLERRYRVADDRILLTGLSDGATMTLVYGLAHPDTYRALAPLCGVLHPVNATNGNLDRAHGVPIYMVHGALDFLFPVERARQAHDMLSAAGALVEYRELPELSHTYPRSENVRIVRWFEGLTRQHGRVSLHAHL